MKSLIPILSASALLALSLTAHADSFIDASLTATGSSATNISAYFPGTYSVTSGTSLVTVTFANVDNTGVLNVTDVCATINLAPCANFALSFTDAHYGATSIGVGVSVAAAADTTLLADTALINIDGSLAASIGGFSDTVVFSGLPAFSNGGGNGGSGGGNGGNGGGNPSPVPEPSTLGLMATGLAGAAGMLRRRFNVG